MTMFTFSNQKNQGIKKRKENEMKNKKGKKWNIDHLSKLRLDCVVRPWGGTQL